MTFQQMLEHQLSLFLTVKFFSEWSVDTGHVIIIDHGDNIISVYKHNSKLLKEQNDYVQAGEVIAIRVIRT